MPRMKQISAAQERDELFAALKSASVLHLKTRFLVHESQETEAMKAFVPAEESDSEEGAVSAEYEALARSEGLTQCPCCGSWCARLVETIDDLEVLVNVDTKQRWNRWENQTIEDFARFDAIAAQAQPYGTELAAVWSVQIDFTCSREAMAQIRDDRTRVIYWSGGWRSSKSHTAAQWWLRRWVLHGGLGELFWLVGPELKVAYRLMERLFLGRGETSAQGWQRGRSVAPKYFDADLKAWRSCIARSLPAHEKVSLMQFPMVDGSIVELRHTKSVKALEGDTVRGVLYDEAIRSQGPEGYEILLGRVQQGGGQLAIASIPGEDTKSWWLFERVVQPAESGQARDKKVYTTSSYANLWIPHYEVVAGEKAQGDDHDLVQRVIYGQWNKAGGMAYGGEWKPEVHAPLAILDAHKPESWGFAIDVTAQAATKLFGPKAREIEYLGARDFNWTQCGIVAKVFGHSATDSTTWALVILDEHLARGDAAKAAADFAERFRSGFYKGKIGLVVDSNGFFKGHTYSGRKSESTDAYEFEANGCLVAPPMRSELHRTKGRSSGGEPRNPGVAESKKLVRRLMGQSRILADGQVCRHTTTAIPQVRAGEKRAKDSGTRSDKTIQAWDDCLRYLTWALFSKEQPAPKKPKSMYRINAPRL